MTILLHCSASLAELVGTSRAHVCPATLASQPAILLSCCTCVHRSRLGAGPLGLAALKQHPWFAPVNWDALLEHRCVRAPPATATVFLPACLPPGSGLASLPPATGVCPSPVCRFPPPAGIRERIYNFEGVAYAHFEPHAFDGDMRWMENF
jgi:hypothetical protein